MRVLSSLTAEGTTVVTTKEDSDRARFAGSRGSGRSTTDKGRGNSGGEAAAAVAAAKEEEEEEEKRKDEEKETKRRGQRGRSVGLAVNAVAGTVLAWREKDALRTQGVCAVRAPCLITSYTHRLGLCDPRDTAASASIVS